MQGVVYELIGIVSSDSDSKTSLENYLIDWQIAANGSNEDDPQETEKAGDCGHV